MPPVIAMRDFRVLSSPPQVVHFIPMQATPRPATVRIMLTIMRARVAWRAPGQEQRMRLIHSETVDTMLFCNIKKQNKTKKESVLTSAERT